MSTLTQIPIAEISPWKDNPRKHIDEEALAELAESIKDAGVVQPIVVRPANDAQAEGTEHAYKYLIVAGERRYRASKLAGLESIPAVVRELTREQALKIAIIENLQREDINAIDEARALSTLLSETSMTQEEVGEKLGKSQEYVANRLRLLDLPETAIEAITAGHLSASHGRALMKFKDYPLVVAGIAASMEKEPMSVKDLEKLSLSDHGIRKMIGKDASRENWNPMSIGCEGRSCRHQHGSNCFNPSCHDEKKAAAEELLSQKREVAISELAESDPSLKGLPALSDFNQNDYRTLHGEEHPDCAACERRTKAVVLMIDGAATVRNICLDPKCHTKKSEENMHAQRLTTAAKRDDRFAQSLAVSRGLLQTPEFILRSILLRTLEDVSDIWDHVVKAYGFKTAEGWGPRRECVGEAVESMDLETIHHLITASSLYILTLRDNYGAHRTLKAAGREAASLLELDPPQWALEDEDEDGDPDDE